MRRTKLSLAIAAFAATSMSVAYADTGYRVTDIGSLEGSIHTSPRDINNQGHIIGQLSDLRSQNVRYDLLDPEVFSFLGEDVDLNDLSDTDKLRVRNALINGTSIGNNPRFQKLAIVLGYQFQGSNLFELDGFESLDEETGQRSDSVDFRARAINDHGIVVGQSALPFYWLEGTDLQGEEARFHVRDGFPVAAWTDGNEYKLLGTDEAKILGGVSSFIDINNNHLAVGFGTFIDGFRLEEIYDDCTTDVDEDGEAIDLEPLQACLYRFWYNSSGRAGVVTPITEERAFAWQLTAQGDVVSSRSFGVTFDSEEDAEDPWQTVRYRSVANAVNNHGVIVGTSTRQLVQGAFNRATIFTDEGAIEAFEADSPYRDVSSFTAINDSNIAVGAATVFAFGAQRQRLFYMDVTNGPSEAIFPTGLYSDVAWAPRAINNHGLVVGTTELRGVQGIQRRSVGFLYDMNTDTTYDLNSFLPCNSEYVINEGVAINDQGEIIASAVRMMDVEVDGEMVETARVRTLLLTPDSSQTGCQEEIDDQTQRKGASITPFWLGVFGLFSLIAIRRKKNAA
ncbi:MAG: DUF3466 family protein [Aliidiomarina sp.]|uniref:DUF3466 family protein n=1 Tax=Aliidiomarina sp. TaxID=1872439 RepID=UPI0025C60F3E|nr:DUF3466 family protein [Aliidiomarina sp.]MCH8502616.1 DUF3466 family protein [Aliidiomarina sp.]